MSPKGKKPYADFGKSTVPMVDDDRYYMDSEDVGMELWVILGDAGSDGRTLEELMDETGWTKNRVKRGLKYINHFLQEEYGRPIAIRRDGTAKGYYYVLPEFYIEAKPWTRNRLMDLRTRTLAEEKRSTSSMLKWPKEVHRLLPRALHRLVEDLDEILTMIPEEPANGNGNGSKSA
jgi:hypothetical protein